MDARPTAETDTIEKHGCGRRFVDSTLGHSGRTRRHSNTSLLTCSTAHVSNRSKVQRTGSMHACTFVACGSVFGWLSFTCNRSQAALPSLDSCFRGDPAAVSIETIDVADVVDLDRHRRHADRRGCQAVKRRPG